MQVYKTFQSFQELKKQNITAFKGKIKNVSKAGEIYNKFIVFNFSGSVEKVGFSFDLPKHILTQEEALGLNSS